MPCGGDWGSGGYGSHEEYTKDARRQANRATRVACELAKLLKKDATLYSKISPRTKRWIKKHEALDRARALAAEKERDKELRKTKIRKGALAKLSDKEKEVLGLEIDSPTYD